MYVCVIISTFIVNRQTDIFQSREHAPTKALLSMYAVRHVYMLSLYYEYSVNRQGTLWSIKSSLTVAECISMFQCKYFLNLTLTFCCTKLQLSVSLYISVFACAYIRIQLQICCESRDILYSTQNRPSTDALFVHVSIHLYGYNVL
jgi:hypothetical protein